MHLLIYKMLVVTTEKRSLPFTIYDALLLGSIYCTCYINEPFGLLDHTMTHTDARTPLSLCMYVCMYVCVFVCVCVNMIHPHFITNQDANAVN